MSAKYFVQRPKLVVRVFFLPLLTGPSTELCPPSECHSQDVNAPAEICPGALGHDVARPPHMRNPGSVKTKLTATQVHDSTTRN